MFHLCVDEDLCAGNVCANGATCIETPGGDYDYKCICPVGYAGFVCHESEEYYNLFKRVLLFGCLKCLACQTMLFKWLLRSGSLDCH